MFNIGGIFFVWELSFPRLFSSHALFVFSVIYLLVLAWQSIIKLKLKPYSLYLLRYQRSYLLWKLFGIWFVMSFSYRYMPKYWCDIYDSDMFKKIFKQGSGIRETFIWTARRNADTPYIKRAFNNYDREGIFIEMQLRAMSRESL